MWFGTSVRPMHELANVETDMCQPLTIFGASRSSIIVIHAQAVGAVEKTSVGVRNE